MTRLKAIAKSRSQPTQATEIEGLEGLELTPASREVLQMIKDGKLPKANKGRRRDRDTDAWFEKLVGTNYHLRIPVSLLFHPKVSDGHLRVYAMMKFFENKDSHEAWPDLGLLTEACGKKRRQTLALRKALTKWGSLRRVEKARRGTTARYTFPKQSEFPPKVVAASRNKFARVMSVRKRVRR